MNTFEKLDFYKIYNLIINQNDICMKNDGSVVPIKFRFPLLYLVTSFQYSNLIFSDFFSDIC